MRASGVSTSATVQPGATVAETVTLSPANGAGTFANAIALSASGLPAGATAVFSPASVPAGSGATTVALAIQLPPAAVATQRPGGMVSRPFARLVPLSLALLLLPLAGRLRRGGKRLTSALLLAFAGMAAMAGVIGCGIVSGSPGQKPQSYTVTVTGTSGALSHSATVTLMVE